MFRGAASAALELNVRIEVTALCDGSVDVMAATASGEGAVKTEDRGIVEERKRESVVRVIKGVDVRVVEKRRCAVPDGQD